MKGIPVHQQSGCWRQSLKLMTWCAAIFTPITVASFYWMPVYPAVIWAGVVAGIAAFLAVLVQARTGWWMTPVILMVMLAGKAIIEIVVGPGGSRNPLAFGATLQYLFLMLSVYPLLSLLNRRLILRYCEQAEGRATVSRNQ
ncbi:MAG: hypothetical protein AB1705_16920 [Verrucomicrobiota bacterium]